MESRELSVEEQALRRLLKKKLLGLASLERTMVRQRSRITWLKEGDACTQFFHAQASHRRRRSITSLNVEGTLVSDHEDKADAMDEFFNLLGSSPDRRGEAVEIRDYRPISLIHSFPELVAKVLATRMAPR